MAACSTRTFISHAVLFVFLFCSPVFIFIGCGGGGGSSGGTDGITYSGLTTPAEITAENSSELVASAYASGNRGMVFGGIAGLQDSNQVQASAEQPFLLDFARFLENAFENIDFSSVSGPGSFAALQTESGTIDGSCGGTGSYSIQVDTNTGAFSGNFKFSGFCEEGTSLNGSALFNGIVNLSTEQLQSFTISFSSISGSSSEESFTMAGDIEFYLSDPSISISMDMLVKDNNLNKVYRVDDYAITVNDFYTYTSIEVSGTFYDPDYGYVTLYTSPPLLIDYNQDYPYSGQLVLLGKTGSAGEPASVRLTALSATTCQVEADTDGDGEFDDYSSDIIQWTAL